MHINVLMWEGEARFIAEYLHLTPPIDKDSSVEKTNK